MMVRISAKWFTNKDMDSLCSDKPHYVRNKFLTERGITMYFVEIPRSNREGWVPEREDFDIKEWLYIDRNGPRPTNKRLKGFCYIEEEDILEEILPTTNKGAAGLLSKEEM